MSKFQSIAKSEAFGNLGFGNWSLFRIIRAIRIIGNSAGSGASRGIITLLSILVVSAIGTAIAVALLLFGVSSSQTSQAVEHSKQAAALADACAQEALQQIRDSESFTGSGSLPLGAESCDYSVASTGGESRLINSSAAVGDAVRKVEVNIDAINPQINITSWQEVADF